MRILSLGQEDPLEEGMATHKFSVFLLGEPHGQRSLVGYGPWGRQELDTTDDLACIVALQCYKRTTMYNVISFQCTVKWISYMYTYTPSLLFLPPTPPPSHLSRSSQSTELNSPYSFPLAIYFAHGSVYMSILMFQFIPPSPSRLFPTPTTPPAIYLFAVSESHLPCS